MNGYAYVQDRGLEQAVSYPYTAKDEECNYDESKVTVRILGAKQYE